MFRKESIVKSFYIIVVVMVNLHHQQSDNLPNTEGNLDLSHHLCTHMCVLLHYYEGKKGISIVGLLAAESVHLTNSLWHPLCHRHWTKLNCWTRDNWLFGVTIEVMKTPDTLSEPPSTELMLLDTLVSSLSVSAISSASLLAVSNLGLLPGPLITPPLTPTVKCILGRITSSLCNTGCKFTRVSEK
jgi:hypothetical protein